MNLLNLNLNKNIDNKNQKNCKGIVFRYTENNFYVSDCRGLRIEFRKSLRMMKRLSCSGCSRCGSLWEDLESTGVERLFKLDSGLKNGHYYKAVFHPLYFDSYTGLCEDWDYILVPYNEED